MQLFIVNEQRVLNIHMNRDRDRVHRRNGANMKMMMSHLEGSPI